ncbi:MAG TPA: NAD-dependent epimerase/dehydratase family protein, partial [Fimbriimonas sp.]|nr:NAD-dependent epimerase/dehydratase family protein [Fimbriimonas sp.]
SGLLPGTGAASTLTNRRVVMIGMDMAVGKMTAGLELYQAAKRKGIDVGFVATGQIGITVTGRGVPLDAVRVDYATGAIEREVMHFQDKQLVIVEGQGSLNHPGSTSTLPLLRGAMPTDLILCARAGQTMVIQTFPMPPINDVIKMYEEVATMCGSFPVAKVRAIALNTSHCSPDERQRYIDDMAQLTSLPVCDAVIDQGETLLSALEIH